MCATCTFVYIKLLCIGPINILLYPSRVNMLLVFFTKNIWQCIIKQCLDNVFTYGELAHLLPIDFHCASRAFTCLSLYVCVCVCVSIYISHFFFSFFINFLLSVSLVLRPLPHSLNYWLCNKLYFLIQ